ncbi:hypothetical protein [Nonomuraea fuscirosea]|uniref:hypothetical protein n=1 Tax=Nonomuraea fuscirosea TaxID=1291556 RepID=UPI0033D49FF4
MERALIRTLSDIEDGHLSLWVNGRFFDPHTGRPLDPPKIRVISDRQPYRGVPDPGGPWWDMLVQRDWLEMPRPRHDTHALSRQSGRPRRPCGGPPCWVAAPPVCGIAWGVCPADGATLAVSGDSTRCQECGRTWPGDRLNQPCPEPITRTEEERHLGRTGMCDGHALALTAVYGITTELLRPGQHAREAGTWDRGGEAARYVRHRYRLPAAKRNARVTVDGRPATILGFRGAYLVVRYEDQPAGRLLCHPTAHVTYATAGQPD